MQYPAFSALIYSWFAIVKVIWCVKKFSAAKPDEDVRGTGLKHGVRGKK